MKTRHILSAAALSLLSLHSASAQNNITVPILPGECWWGAATNLGPQMPFEGDTRVFDLHAEDFNNQTGPLMVSSKGRYLWCDAAYSLQQKDGALLLASPEADVTLHEGGTTLRDAYLAVSKHFPPSGQIPPELFFTRPIYNSWIELTYDQNQADIMRYARGIIANGMEPGVLMIDDNWQRDYGDWEFRAERFPNPKGMIDELHAMGFKVMLWVCPFVSPDCKLFRDHRDLFVHAKNDWHPAILEWWNGHSASYDFSNPDAYKFFVAQLDDLQKRYGVDGFKFDAGDPERYQRQNVDVFDGKSFDIEQSRLWAQLAKQYPYNELRACWGEQSQPLVQRLGDKPYSWKGVGDLVPAMINAGLLGYQFTCPDMIGGGDYATFLGVKVEDFDPALIIRSCQIHSMMPMMQFSVAPWRILKPEYMEIVRHYADLHVQMGDYILAEARKAAETGEPIVRHMDYSFPGEGFEAVTDQYMLGDRYLVAPVATPDLQRTVKLPKGKWRDEQGKVYKGGKTYTLDVPLERLPYFERVK